MPKFIFAYHGGKMPETQEEIEIVMGKWRSWMEQNSAALIDPGNPVGKSKTVSASGIADDGGANPLSGYTIVEAVTMDAAVAIAQKCPHLENGTIEIAEIQQM